MDTERCNDDRLRDHRAAGCDLLHRDGRADLQRLVQDLRIELAALLAVQPELGIAEAAAPRHGKADDRTGARRADACAHDAVFRDKNGVEHHVQHAHCGVENARREHVAAALQAGRGKRIEL